MNLFNHRLFTNRLFTNCLFAKKLSTHYRALMLLLALGVLAAPPDTVFAQGAQGAEDLEEVVVTGSRRAPRSVGDSAAPIDVLSGDDFENQGASDIGDMLRTLVPSYNVNIQPISDAAALVRPANLRGLPPDNTLVLVNGKRRHRGSVITFLGAGLSNGAQGPDVWVIPAIALRQLEVLRDGASAQYGSDAIAGVLNFLLKENAEGISVETRYGEFYEGDGENWKLAANIGMPLTAAGFLNLSLEVSDSSATSRSVQRQDAADLNALGNTAIRNPAQIWGSPDVKDDYKFFANAGLDLGEGSQAYAFGNYAERQVLGGFFFRNPTNRSGVFSPSGAANGILRLVGDLTPEDGVDCPAVNVRVDGSKDSTQPIDEAALAAIIAEPNCFVFNARYPGGFTPNFGGDVTDFSLFAGVKGETPKGLVWDVSLGLGSHKTQFEIINTVNASLGPASPNEFNIGSYAQLEKNFNLDLAYPMTVAGFYSPLNIGFGFEYREEQFEVISGDEAGWITGPLFAQGFGVGSNGFSGFGPQDAGLWDRGNFALYLDLEADLTEALLLGAAVRFEDFEDFGSTANGKLSARYAFSDSFSARSTYSTGFRAPTPGQGNITNVLTFADNANGMLRQRGTIPPTNPVAQLYGGEALTEEQSTNFSIGFVWDITDQLNVTLDYFDITLKDRITLGATVVLDDAGRAALLAAGVVGADDLSEFQFYTNDFDTQTRGIDLVATYGFNWAAGATDLILAYNQTTTELDSPLSTTVNITRKFELERGVPDTRWYLTGLHHAGNWRFLLRLSYYDEYTDAGASPESNIVFGDEYLVDAEVAYTWRDRYTLVLGAQNLLDEYPDEDPRSLDLGNKYPEDAPAGFNGGFYYSRFRIDF